MDYVQIVGDRSIAGKFLCAEFIMKSAANSTIWLICNLTVSRLIALWLCNKKIGTAVCHGKMADSPDKVTVNL